MQKLVTYDAKVSYLRCKSQLLTMRKSVTYDAKVSYLRPVIYLLMKRITSVRYLRIEEKVWLFHIKGVYLQKKETK